MMYAPCHVFVAAPCVWSVTTCCCRDDESSQNLPMVGMMISVSSEKSSIVKPKSEILPGWCGCAAASTTSTWACTHIIRDRLCMLLLDTV